MISPPDRSAGTHPLLLDSPGHTAVLLGNEAIVRGALEANVGFASGYPGTPSSEVTDTFARIHGAAGIHFEYSVNEKVALEMAFAASLAGARAICAMKHLGLMYAGDPLATIPYVGPQAGLVIVSAGDPSCRTSPNEQDQRHLGHMLFLPMLDPSTPAEAHRMARFAFDLSEQSQLPVVLRITTRICHSRGPVVFGPMTPRPGPARGFVRDPRRHVPIPANARPMRQRIEKKLEQVRRALAGTDYVRRSGPGPLAILASGSPAATCADLLSDLGLKDRVALITVNAVYPLLEERLLELLQDVTRVLVVEELTPYLEDALSALLARRGLALELLGKCSGHLPGPFEYEPELIQRAIYRGLGLGSEPRPAVPAPELPGRPPILCAGCPHRATYFAARAAFGEDQLYFSDIGCYTLGYGPPLNTADALLCMGASITLAAGVSRVTGQRTVGFVGDSTFFHSGMPALLDAVKEGSEMVLVILDNQVTAMTGFQQSPLVRPAAPGEKGAFEREISIEAVVRALGVKQVQTVDPSDLAATISVLQQARQAPGLAVVISQAPCVNFLQRETGRTTLQESAVTCEVDQERCRICHRERGGLRCSQPLTEGFERHRARARALEARAADTAEAVPGHAARPEAAPCSARCPLSLCVQGYVGHIAANEPDEALSLILSRNPLPETVCRVCHQPCEEVCLRAELDEPVAINALKRFVVHRAAAALAPGVIPPPWEAAREPEHGLRAAVVGAGPAGLAAAWDLRLRGYQVTLLDAADEPGGLLRSGIPAFRLPREALSRDIARILSLGVTFRGRTVLGRDLALADLLEGPQAHHAVFLAVGAQRSLALGLGEEDQQASGLPRVVDALTYLEQVNLGRPVQTGERVVVVGGGNAAMDAARTALRRGARQVTIAYRRRLEEMPAIAAEVEAARAEGAELCCQLQPLSLVRGRTPGLECVRTEPGEPDRSGRCRPVPVGGSETLLGADQIIVAIGQAADPGLLGPGDWPLELESDGSLLVSGETAQTSCERVFAGGDVVRGERTVTAAMAWGLRAAWGIDRALRGPEVAEKRRPPPPPSTVRVLAGGPWTRRPDRGTPRQIPPSRPGAEAIGSFEEVAGPPSEAQARDEAVRCLACGLCGNCRACIDLFGCPAFYLDRQGRISIDAALCIGCGVCAELCPNGAIRPGRSPR